MEHNTAVKILENIKTDEKGLKRHLVLSAVHYARLRADWRLADVRDRMEMDSARTAAHNALIDAANVLSRAMVKAGEDPAWRRRLTNDRQEIGDWACHVHAHLGIEGR
jgi:hypothetical protein